MQYEKCKNVFKFFYDKNTRSIFVRIYFKGRSKYQYGEVDYQDFHLIKDYTWFLARSRNNYYIETRIVLSNGEEKILKIHQLLLPNKPGFIRDHKDGGSLNNRRYNLRYCTYSQNTANSCAIGKSSKYRGVFWDKGRKTWRVQIVVLGNRKAGKSFHNELQAAVHYDKLAIKYFGEFAKTNFLISNYKSLKGV